MLCGLRRRRHWLHAIRRSRRWLSYRHARRSPRDDHPAPSPRASRVPLRSPARRLDCLVADHAVCHPFYVSFPLQMFEVGERLGEREAERVIGEILGENAARDLEWRRRPPVEGCEHYREALFMVREELVDTPFQVVKERTVPGEDEVHVQTPQARNRVEVTPERPRGRIWPQPYVRSDLEQEVVSGEQEPPSLVVQDEVKI